MQHCRGGDLPGALEILARGRSACGERPELVLKTAEILTAAEPARALAYLEGITAPAQASDNLLRIWLDAAGRAGRSERVLAISQEAIRRNPNDAGARRWEAHAYLHLDRPSDAVAALDVILPARSTDPAITRLYSLAHARSGWPDRAEQFATELLERAGRLDSAVGAARGLFAAGQSVAAARWGRHVLDLGLRAAAEQALNSMATFSRTGPDEPEIESVRKLLSPDG